MRPKKSVVEIESDALSCWCFLRDLWQTEDHPGVDLSKTELSHQTEPVHGPEWQTDIVSTYNSLSYKEKNQKSMIVLNNL